MVSDTNDSKPIEPKKTTRNNNSRSKQATTPVTDGFKRFLRAVDNNLMPILAWIALVGLAVRGATTLLSHMSSTYQIAIAIIVVAFLAFKLR